MLKLLIAFSLLLTVQNNTAFAQSSSANIKAESKVMRADALRLWQKREDQGSLTEALIKFEHLHASEQENLELLTYLARGYFLLAEYHLEDPEQKMKNYQKSKDYGERGMKTNPEYAKKEKSDVVEAIGVLTKREVPVTFWAAAALGKWAKLNGIMSSLKFKNQILAMIKQVEKLEPDYFYGAVPRYWGGYYAIAPRIAGGDMNKSKKNFEKAISSAPEYLGSRVLFAELYWTEKNDKKAFKKELETVLKAPLGPLDIQPENSLDKGKAKKLLDKADKMFFN